MSAKVILFSYESDEINNFLNKFYSSNIVVKNASSWKKDFSNPIEISEIIAAYADNINSFDISMWISLDKNTFIKISPSNVNYIIKYLFERYPY